MWRHEEISDCLEDWDKTSQAADGTEALHHSLSFSKRHVRILRAIVQALV
jgi:hypothetical protein